MPVLSSMAAICLSHAATEHFNVADVTEKQNFSFYGNLIKFKQSPVPHDYHTGQLDYTAW